MPEEVTKSAPLNGTTGNNKNILNAATTQTVPAIQEPAATRRAIITNAHVIERVTGQHHGGELSGDEVTEDEGPDPEIIANDEDLMDDFPPDIEEVELVHLRIGSIALLKLERFNQIQKLCLRQNHIYEIEALDHLSDNLKELDLYDNGISSIRNLEKLTKLESLDLSFNKIKHIKRVNHLVELRNLYFVQNKITRIEGLEGLVRLRNLELGANKIREIDNLDTLKGLEELWLGKNKITQLKNLSALTNLKILSIQSNRLTEIVGLENLVSLEEFYISHNAIREITGLENNMKLRVLDVTSNRITNLSGLKHLENLEELWASNNELSSFEEVEKELGDKNKLSTVYFEGNPLQLDNGATYRNKIRLALPQIQQIDATFVRPG
ncbi:protein phosphatases PP1 regulatory subunit sds22 [Terfezia boudieri ATCC MYA-4762]|uniref:Protein phosphatases PP1 regulatory subunit sds22 n=1 Tax=Terfezia boudieri ATCC MYA-4762 TaxID=1051890 RepID=A0A3N4M4Q5_9PEZI|nr:protein phosphatases PP1 regulatory subunit sds22 [Terfezia boudieri ATCC MYA-4762]